MALTFTRSNLTSLFATGKVPTGAHFAAFINAIPMVYVEEAADLVSGVDYEIEHDGNEKVREVIGLTSSSDGYVRTSLNFRLDATDPLNKVIIMPTKNYTGIDITLLLK